MNRAFACFLASLMLTSSAQAEQIWMRCDLCNYQVAEQAAVAAGPERSLVFHSYSTGAAFAFHTRSEMVGTNCQPQHLEAPATKGTRPASTPRMSDAGCQQNTVATPIQLSAEDMELVALFKYAYDETNGTMKRNETYSYSSLEGASSPPGPVAGDPGNITAYDFHIENMRTHLLRIVEARVRGGDGSFLSVLNNALGNVLDKAFFGADTIYNITVLFDDGSKIEIEIKTDSGEIVRKEIVSSLDPNGNRVMGEYGAPEASSYSGEHSFYSQRDAENWLNNARLNGVKISNERSGNRVHCTWDGDSNVLSCSMQ